MGGKIVSETRAVAVSNAARKRGQKVVTTNGCFDLMHVGHVRSLTAARRLGDLLIVGVNSDASVRRLKGKGRPLVPLAERMEMLAAFDAVDYVFAFNDKTPERWLGKIRPSIHAKGSDRTLAQIPERVVVEKYGGRVVLLPHTRRHSTTSLIRKAGAHG